MEKKYLLVYHFKINL